MNIKYDYEKGIYTGKTESMKIRIKKERYESLKQVFTQIEVFDVNYGAFIKILVCSKKEILQGTVIKFFTEAFKNYEDVNQELSFLCKLACSTFKGKTGGYYIDENEKVLVTCEVLRRYGSSKMKNLNTFMIKEGFDEQVNVKSLYKFFRHL